MNSGARQKSPICLGQAVYTSRLGSPAVPGEESMKKYVVVFVVFAALCVTRTAQATSIFANTLVSQQFTTSFGSGLVTGAPDGGGLFLGDTFDPPAHPGFIVVSFATPLVDGPGADLRVYDVANSAN